MKICAVTMVYRDYWALSQWYAHYSKHLKAEHLYIVAHGHDPKIAEICPKANIQTIPRNDLSHFDRKRGELLNDLQDKLGRTYDWVIRTDADELICFDPDEHLSIQHGFEKFEEHSVVFALGLNLIEAADEEEFDESDLVLQHRSNAIFSGHYSKAFAVKKGVHLARHGFVAKEDVQYFMPKGVYLVHLKYANLDALQTTNTERLRVAMGEEDGLPGSAWKDPDRVALRNLREIEVLPKVEWEQAASEAYRKLFGLPETEADKGIVRARSLKFNVRTSLPHWFKDY